AIRRCRPMCWRVAHSIANIYVARSAIAPLRRATVWCRAAILSIRSTRSCPRRKRWRGSKRGGSEPLAVEFPMAPVGWQRGGRRALIALGHTLLVIVYHLASERPHHQPHYPFGRPAAPARDSLAGAAGW